MNILYHHRTRAEDVEGVHIRGIIGGLRGLGHTVDIVAPPGVQTELVAPRVAKAAAPSRWKTFARRAPEAIFEMAEVGYNAYAYAALLAHTRRTRYDFIYERYALFLGAGLAIARQRHVPYILEVNDSAVVDRIRKLSLTLPARALEKQIWRNADAIVTITDYFRELIVGAGVNRRVVHVIPNGVDREVFADESRLRAAAAEHRRRLGLGDALVIGYVGALNYWRRIDLLVDAFATLAARHANARLLLVGEGVDRPDIETQLAARGLTDKVIFAGRVPHAEVPGILAAIDIAVLPHSNVYGSPMKLFEYLAAGAAVVAPDLSPISSILAPSQIGCIFAPLELAALTDTLEKLIVDPGARVTMAKKARHIALEKYTWRRHAQTVLDLVHNLD